MLKISRNMLIYDNLRDIEKNIENIEEKSIAVVIFLIKMGANKEYIYNYLKDKNMKVVNLEENILEKVDNLLLENLELKDELNKKEKIFNENLNLINSFMGYYENSDYVKWLPTNNRKTDNFYADYGLEINELIKFIKMPFVIDYSYTDTIRRLKIDTFEKYLEGNINILGIRAILSSIIASERNGVGYIARANKSGLIYKLLKKYIELVRG